MGHHVDNDTNAAHLWNHSRPPHLILTRCMLKWRNNRVTKCRNIALKKSLPSHKVLYNTVTNVLKTNSNDFYQDIFTKSKLSKGRPCLELGLRLIYTCAGLTAVRPGIQVNLGYTVSTFPSWSSPYCTPSHHVLLRLENWWRRMERRYIPWRGIQEGTEGGIIFIHILTHSVNA